MDESKQYPGGWIIGLVFVGLLGYFIYGGVDGALAVMLFDLIMSLSIIIALVPFIGVCIQYLVLTNYAIPWTFGITGISATWLTTALLTIYIIFGAIVTIYTTWWVVIEKLR